MAQMIGNIRERLFRENSLFSREDILKSFEFFIEHEKLTATKKRNFFVLIELY